MSAPFHAGRSVARIYIRFFLDATAAGKLGGLTLTAVQRRYKWAGVSFSGVSFILLVHAVLASTLIIIHRPHYLAFGL